MDDEDSKNMRNISDQTQENESNPLPINWQINFNRNAMGSQKENINGQKQFSTHINTNFSDQVMQSNNCNDVNSNYNVNSNCNNASYELTDSQPAFRRGYGSNDPRSKSFNAHVSCLDRQSVHLTGGQLLPNAITGIQVLPSGDNINEHYADRNNFVQRSNGEYLVNNYQQNKNSFSINSNQVNEIMIMNNQQVHMNVANQFNIGEQMKQYQKEHRAVSGLDTETHHTNYASFMPSRYMGQPINGFYKNGRDANVCVSNLDDITNEPDLNVDDESYHANMMKMEKRSQKLKNLRETSIDDVVPIARGRSSTMDNSSLMRNLKNRITNSNVKKDQDSGFDSLDSKVGEDYGQKAVNLITNGVGLDAGISLEINKPQTNNLDSYVLSSDGKYPDMHNEWTNIRKDKTYISRNKMQNNYDMEEKFVSGNSSNRFSQNLQSIENGQGNQTQIYHSDWNKNINSNCSDAINPVSNYDPSITANSKPCANDNHRISSMGGRPRLSSPRSGKPQTEDKIQENKIAFMKTSKRTDGDGGLMVSDKPLTEKAMQLRQAENGVTPSVVSGDKKAMRKNHFKDNDAKTTDTTNSHDVINWSYQIKVCLFTFMLMN